MKTEVRSDRTAEDPSRNPVDWLTLASLVYIALPNLLFLLSWVRPIIGVPIAVALLFAIGRYRPQQAEARDSMAGPTPATVLFIVLAATAWAALGGAGHIGFANFDWRTRDATYGDLMRYSWPVAYQLQEGVIVILRTAMGYYLPAAALAKAIGTQYADMLLFAWTVAGTAIFLLLLPVPKSRHALGWTAALIIVIMFSGMDALGSWIDDFYVWPSIPDHLEWWAGKFQYSSMSTQLFWVPNHALAAWIAAALFFRHRGNPDYLDQGILTLALLPLWSPFAALGFAPFVGLAMWQSARKERALKLRPLTALVSCALVYITGRLLTSGIGNIPVSTTLASGPRDTAEFISYYVLFVLFEFGLLAMILAYRIKGYGDLLWTTSLVLLVLPFARLGPGNDIVMRASIPALTVLCLLTIVAVTKPATPARNQRASTLLLTAVLALGSVTAIHEMARTVMYKSWPANYSRTLREQQRGQLPYHYVGRLDSADLKWLLNPPESVN